MTVRVLKDKDEAVKASEEARLDYLVRLKRNGFATPTEYLDKWWPHCRKDERMAARPDQHGNVIAEEGCTRCDCGCKYWENDKCVSCGADVRYLNDTSKEE